MRRNLLGCARGIEAFVAARLDAKLRARQLMK